MSGVYKLTYYLYHLKRESIVSIKNQAKKAWILNTHILNSHPFLKGEIPFAYNQFSSFHHLFVFAKHSLKYLFTLRI